MRSNPSTSEVGGHWIPLGGRLWRDGYSLYRHFQSCVSSALVIAWLYVLWRQCHHDLYVFLEWYGGSWIVFSWWLTTVTYLQHHDNTVQDTLVYDDRSWSFVQGALQTVDRRYGTWLDRRMHHITDGHLAHHLFFTKIPHYHLPLATKALYAHFRKHGIEYKCRDTPYFFFDIFRMTTQHMSEVTLYRP